MPNNQKSDCPNKPAIDAKAKKAIDAADPVLQNANAAPADLRAALKLANDTLKEIMGDHHHL
jgi:hypothetical protein